MLHVPSSPENSLFLSRGGHEDDRAFWRRALRESAGNRKHCRDAGRIVIRAVVNRITVYGGADTHVIVVRTDHDDLIAKHGVTAGKHADDVVADATRRIRNRGERLHAVEKSEPAAPVGGDSR